MQDTWHQLGIGASHCVLLRAHWDQLQLLSKAHCRILCKFCTADSAVITNKVLCAPGLGSSVIAKLALPRALSLVSAHKDTATID